jgi:Xaa-Pro aminopeptidase
LNETRVTILDKLRASLEEQGLKGFIHFQTNKAHENVTLRYLTGVQGLEDSGVIVPTDSEPVLIVKEFEESRARTFSTIKDVRGCTTIPLSAAAKQLGQVIDEKNLRGKKLGVDQSELTLEVYEQLQKLGVELVPFGEKIASMRITKLPEEIANIRRAAELASMAIERIGTLLNDGLTEAELAAEATFTMEKHGGAKAFVSVQYAQNASVPHHSPDSTRIQGSGLLVVDLGARVAGYNSDITRTFVVGSPPQEHLSYIKAVRESVSHAVERVRPGVNVEEVARAARSVLSKWGLPQPAHRIGHGLGLSVHEKPVVEEGFNHTLDVGTVFTIEPGVYVPNVTGCRIEVDALVTHDGAELIDRLPF